MRQMKIIFWFILIMLPVTAHAKEMPGPHVVGVFLGRTQGPYETADTIGLEYEFRFSNYLGAGLVLEETRDGHHGYGTRVWVASVYYHVKDWRFGLGAGRERIDSTPSHTEPLKRLSLGYDFHLGGIGLAPTFALDRVDGENIKVWGLAIVKSF